MSKILITAIITLSLGATGGYWFAQQTAANNMDAMSTSTETMTSDEEKPLFYRNPMNPAITSPVFTQDDMGMDYIAVYANDNNNNEPPGTVTIDPVVVQNIGVRTKVAQQKAIARTINALGHIDFNEEYLTRLHPKTSGWIGALKIDETGKRVDKNTILLSIYSPDLVAAQREFLVALKNWESVKANGGSKMQQSTQNIFNGALERLQLFDVPTHQIENLKKTKKIQKYLHIHSPFNGTVMNIGAREGQYVSPKDELYLIADLKRIWVHVEVYEDDLPWVKEGDEVEMRVRAAPGRLFKGKVRFIYPYLEGKTRTVRVRLEFNNTDLVLKPGMFANVLIKADPQKNAVVVPSEAIVRSGNREQIFVQRGPGKYEPREVILGLSSDGFTQIRTGLDVGERVVTSAVFLIDSESKLREATAKMMEITSDDGDMSDMDMGDLDMGEMDMSGMEMDGLDMNDLNMGNMSNENDSKTSGANK